MAKLQKREKNLLIVLGIIVAIGAVDFIINTEDYLSYYSAEKKNAVDNAGKIGKVKAEVHKNAAMIQYKTWGQDPFYDSTVRVKRKVYRPVVKEVTFQLKAISFSEGKSVAMINSQILSVGDKIEGYIVKSIQQKQVILEKDGQSKTLMLQ